MSLWMAAVLFVLVTAGLICIIVFARRKWKMAQIIASIAVLSVVLLMLLAYILLTFIFIDALNKQPPDSHYYCVWDGEYSTDKEKILADLALFIQECDSILAGFPKESSAYDKYLYELFIEVSKKTHYNSNY